MMAPQEMNTVSEGNVVYFRPGGSNQVFSCHLNILGKEHWSSLPDAPPSAFSLVVIEGLLTAVGGWDILKSYNSLFCLVGSDGSLTREWKDDIYPPMPTAHGASVSVTTEKFLIVAGGSQCGQRFDTVEAMSISDKYWMKVCSMPFPLSQASAAVLGDQLYIAGGYSKGDASKFIPSVTWSHLSPQTPYYTLPPQPTRQEYGDMSEIFLSLSLLSSYLEVTCWLLVGEMTQGNSLLMCIDMTPQLTHGCSPVT